MSSTPATKKPRLINDSNAMNEQTKTTIANMLDGLDAMESCSDPSQLTSLATQTSNSLLKLKSLQRNVLEQLKQASASLKQGRAQLNKQHITLEALKYEESILKSQIGANVATPHLERMCREETQQQQDASSLEETMNEFLCGSKDTSYQNVNNYQTVLAKLHREINLRGSLERDAIQAQKALTAKQHLLEKRQTFLKELPKKLASMEKASLPLQKFFSTNSPNDNTIMIGTERSKRLELAASIPGPLYTLFIQLQSYLDASPPEKGVSIDVVQNSQKNTTNTDDWFQPDEHAVQLQLAVPETKNKHVTIEFMYLPKLNVVTARASGSQDKVDLPSLLVNMFEGDDGRMVWSADSVHLKDEPKTKMPGRPFHWCNYLAGIHLPTNNLNPISTRAIVKQLLARLNANSTLTHILTILRQKPNPIPTHASWKQSAAPSTTTKLVAWEKQDVADSNEYTKTFVATLKRKNTRKKATVTIDMSRYPSVAPRWTLTEGQEYWGELHGSTEALQDGTNPLYDNALGQMERTINTRLQDLVCESNVESYNWILAHQLYRLIQLWDDSQQAAEEGESAGQVPRSIKGKDRTTVES